MFFCIYEFWITFRLFLKKKKKKNILLAILKIKKEFFYTWKILIILYSNQKPFMPFYKYYYYYLKKYTNHFQDVLKWRIFFNNECIIIIIIILIFNSFPSLNDHRSNRVITTRIDSKENVNINMNCTIYNLTFRLRKTHFFDKFEILAVFQNILVVVS